MRRAAGSRFTAFAARARMVRCWASSAQGPRGPGVGAQPGDQRGLSRGGLGRAEAQGAGAGQPGQEQVDQPDDQVELLGPRLAGRRFPESASAADASSRGNRSNSRTSAA